jgi:hypothetical protein
MQHHFQRFCCPFKNMKCPLKDAKLVENGVLCPPRFVVSLKIDYLIFLNTFSALDIRKELQFNKKNH